MATKSVLKNLPNNLSEEVFETILQSDSIRIERITSLGHTTPENKWYDQDEDEWVMIIQGSANLTFADGTTTQLTTGDYINIPAHCKHRVTWTDPKQPTVWLAVFY